MALDQSVLSELLAAFQSGEGLDLIRESVRLVCQELIETEVSALIGAGRYERSDERTNERNGHRARTLTTKAGDVELAIPKLRRGSFFPSILEPRRRIDQALYAVVMEAYPTSTGSPPARSTSWSKPWDRPPESPNPKSAGFAPVSTRPSGRSGAARLDHARFPYIWLDATYLHVRSEHQVTSKAVVVATGVTEDGRREIVGIEIGDSDEAFWREFLRSLKRRGLAGVRLVISDQHAGLVAAIGRCFQGAAHQRCRVHFARNLLANIPKGHQEMVAAAFRTIFAQVSPEEIAAQWDHVEAMLAERFDKAAALMRRAKEEVLAFRTFPRAHWRQIWSTNPLERLNKEIKRRSRVVGIFPNEAAAIRLCGAVVLDINDEWASAERRYFSEGSMAGLYPPLDDDDATPGETRARRVIATGDHSLNPHHFMGRASRRPHHDVLGPARQMLPHDLRPQAPGDPLPPAASVERGLEGCEGQELVRGGLPETCPEVAERGGKIEHDPAQPTRWDLHAD